MTAKKWLWMFALTALAMAVLLGLFNVLTDPFGVFGDPVMKWYSFDSTNNPRTAKFSYLEQDGHFDEYDSYIVGCSSTSSFPKEAFDRLFDADFYNMIVYGADMLDSEQTVNYLIAHDSVRNIVLNVYIDNAAVYDDEANPYTHSMPAKVDGSCPIPYYARFLFASPEYGLTKLKNRREDTWLAQSFDVFDEESGAYDKRRRDAEPISGYEDYLTAYPVFADYPTGDYAMPAVDDCLASLARIKAACEEHGVTLTVVTAPVYADYLNCFRQEDVKRFWKGVAEITDFWDFSYSSVSFEPRYFYDGTHFRNCVGEMAAARIAGDGSVWMPEDFGHYVTAENADAYLETYFDAKPMEPESFTAEIPVLMYHSISDEPGNDMAVSPEKFREQMRALSDAGYTTVSTAELYDYVKNGGNLPEKPVLITFDDGYLDNYTEAFPVLREFGMKAAVFAVGMNFGQDTYRGEGEHPIRPHFTAEQAREMTDSGLIEIGSHTFAMHAVPEWETDEAYTDLRQPDTIGEAQWLAVIRADFDRQRELLTGCGGALTSLAFPEGKFDDNALALAKEEGILVSFTADGGKHTLVRGLEQSLYAVSRIHVGDVSGAELLDRLK